MSIASKMIELATCFPCVGTDDHDFMLTLPQEICQKSYEIVVQQVEFRRKCMNQGFDNLLELLQMHYENSQVIRKAARDKKASSDEETNGTA